MFSVAWLVFNVAWLVFDAVWSVFATAWSVFMPTSGSSVIKEGVNSSGSNMSGLNGHNPELLKPFTAFFIEATFMKVSLNNSARSL